MTNDEYNSNRAENHRMVHSGDQGPPCITSTSEQHYKPGFNAPAAVLEAMQAARRVASNSAPEALTSWPTSSTRPVFAAQWASRMTPPLLPQLPVLVQPATTLRQLHYSTLEEALCQLQLSSPRQATVSDAATFLQTSYQDAASAGLSEPLPPLLSVSAIMAHDRLESAREDNFEEPAIRQQAAGAQLWHVPCLAERMFRTPVEAQRALNAFARPHGYAIVYKGTSYDKRRQKRLIRYGCDRHGAPRSHREHSNPPKRLNVSSRKCGCLMEVYLVRTAGSHGDIGWLLQHRGRANQHNHPPSSHAASHPMHRRVSHTEAARLAIALDGETGATARQTIARLLVEDPGLLLVPRDVYNERARATRAALGGLSRIERLLQKLQDGPFQVNYQYDEHHHLTHLFFAHNDAIDIYRTNYDVIIMDCTYRTNRFNMPLFNIMGVTGMNTTIHIAQVFLIGEEEHDFRWALRQLEHLLSRQGIPPPQVFLTDRDLALLNALEQVFPDTPALLCLWHIMKDVQAHARRVSFPREFDPVTSLLQDSGDHQTFCEAFLRVVYAPTEEDYHFRRHELHLLTAVEASYIDDVWLDIWKRRIVRCWTDQVLHFGMHATSRVEGYHATLKSWLGTSSGDLLTVHTRMEHWWRQSIERHWVLHSNAEVYVPIRLRDIFFAAVIRVIHTHALLRCVESLQRVETLLKPCTSSYEMTWGIPCAHSLHKRVTTGVGLRPTDFHPHWWIRRHQAPLELPARILEPERIEDRRARRALERRARRHAAGNGLRGTRRIPSNFEVYSNE